MEAEEGHSFGADQFKDGVVEEGLGENIFGLCVVEVKHLDDFVEVLISAHLCDKLDLVEEVLQLFKPLFLGDLEQRPQLDLRQECLVECGREVLGHISGDVQRQPDFFDAVLAELDILAQLVEHVRAVALPGKEFVNIHQSPPELYPCIDCIELVQLDVLSLLFLLLRRSHVLIQLLLFLDQLLDQLLVRLLDCWKAEDGERVIVFSQVIGNFASVIDYVSEIENRFHQQRHKRALVAHHWVVEVYELVNRLRKRMPADPNHFEVEHLVKYARYFCIGQFIS